MIWLIWILGFLIIHFVGAFIGIAIAEYCNKQTSIPIGAYILLGWGSVYGECCDAVNDSRILHAKKATAIETEGKTK